MPMCLFIPFAFAVLFVDLNNAVSSKMDFGEEGASETFVNTNASNVSDEDVEVKHTIVVSTKLKNNNRKGIHSDSNGDMSPHSFYRGRKEKPKKEDSGEVKIVSGNKALDSTRLYAEDTRNKPKVYPDAFFINRNVRDDNDVFPEVALTPSQWKPSSFFNNINYWSSGDSRGLGNIPRNYRPGNQPSRNFHRKINDDSTREFYCNRCKALSNGQAFNGCSQQRSNWIQTTTTPKMKIDGKLANLN